MSASSVLTQLAASLVGTIAFSLLFGIPKKYYAACGAIGMTGWGAYLFFRLFLGPTSSTVFAAVIVVFLSRLCAVLLLCPATVFLIAGIFPLIPGGGIYWTTYYLVVGMQNLAVKTGYSAVKTAAAIVLGIVLVGLIPQKVFRFLGARFSKGAARE